MMTVAICRGTNRLAIRSLMTADLATQSHRDHQST